MISQVQTLGAGQGLVISLSESITQHTTKDGDASELMVGEHQTPDSDYWAGLAGSHYSGLLTSKCDHVTLSIISR